MQIELDDISKAWGEIRALDRVSCTAEASELLVMLGPSGCGKSTILRLIAGLETLSGGAIRIGGRDVTQLPPAKRNISMVFQSYALSQLADLVAWMYAVVPRPMVIDADGLYALAQHQHSLAKPGRPRIWTPHPGEFRRFIGSEPLSREQMEQRAAAMAAAQQVVIVLKGHNTFVTDGKHAGVVSLIARKGRIVNRQTYGKRDLEAGLPMEKDKICRIYSMSKIVTSVAVLMLLEEARFRLDDPIGDYLPEAARMKVLTGGTVEKPLLADAKTPITFRHLLTHTSGLTYDFGDGTWTPVSCLMVSSSPMPVSVMMSFVIWRLRRASSV